MNIESALAAFIVACRADGLSDKTVKWYGALIRPMVDWFIGREIETVTTQELREYIVSLSERDTRHGKQRPVQAGGLSDESVKSHKRAILRFWKWAADEYEFNDPGRRIKRPAKSKGNPAAAISGEDMVKMIKAAARPDYAEPTHRIRDLAIVLLLADSTARASGLLSITVKDVFIENRTAIVTEKGDKLRRIHFMPLTAWALANWLAIRPETSSDALFLALSLTGKAKGALKYAGLYGILKRLAVRAGIEGRFNPHSFRHGFAKEYLQSGGDLASLSQLMGHTSIVTTSDAYGQFERDQLTDTHDKHSPIRKLTAQ